MGRTTRIIDKAQDKGLFVRFHYTKIDGEQGIRIVQPQGIGNDRLYAIDFTEGKSGGIKSFYLEKMAGLKLYQPPWSVAPMRKTVAHSPVSGGRRWLWLALIVALGIIAYLILAK